MMTTRIRLAALVLGMAMYRTAETGEAANGTGAAPEPTEAEKKAAVAADAKAKKAADKKEADKKAKEEKDAATAKAKEDKTAAAKKAAEDKAAAKVEKNGVTRPLSGATLEVWKIADRLSMTKKAPASRAEVVEEGAKKSEAFPNGINAGTINTQYGKWAKFNGVVAAKAEKKAAAEPATDAGAEQAAA